MNFGIQPNGMLWLNCDRLSLLDEDLGSILKSFIANCKNISLLRHLSATFNFLTRIPSKVRVFPSLTVLNFAANKIASIKADDFKFNHTNKAVISDDDEDRFFLFVSHNEISYIESFISINPPPFLKLYFHGP